MIVVDGIDNGGRGVFLLKGGKLDKDERRQAMAELEKLFEDWEEANKIKGDVLDFDKAAKYKELAQKVAEFFLPRRESAEITVEPISRSQSNIAVMVKLCDFDLGEEDYEAFFELIKMSDEVVFFGEEQNYLSVSFAMNDIWKE